MTLNLEEGEADVTTRANNGWRATEPTLKEGSVEFEMAYDPADTGFAKILGGWLNRIVIPMAILSWFVIERPALRLKDQWAPRHSVSPTNTLGQAG